MNLCSTWLSLWFVFIWNHFFLNNPFFSLFLLKLLGILSLHRTSMLTILLNLKLHYLFLSQLRYSLCSCSLFKRQCLTLFFHWISFPFSFFSNNLFHCCNITTWYATLAILNICKYWSRTATTANFVIIRSIFQRNNLFWCYFLLLSIITQLQRYFMET